MFENDIMSLMEGLKQANSAYKRENNSKRQDLKGNILRLITLTVTE